MPDDVNEIGADERVVEIEMERLREFRYHPFKSQSGSADAAAHGKYWAVWNIKSFDCPADSGGSLRDYLRPQKEIRSPAAGIPETSCDYPGFEG